MFDITVTTLDGVNYLTYVADTAGRPWYRSGPTGTGAFSLWKGNTQPLERWTAARKNYSQKVEPGFYGALLGYADCGGSAFTGQHWFYDYEDDFFVGPNPDGCNGLQMPSGGGFPRKVQAGNRGPGSDMIWVMTDATRVYGYMTN